MLVIAFSCLLLVALTTVIHYEALRLLNVWLPALTIRARSKLLVVIFVTFVAHTIQIGVYAAAFYILIRHMGLGSLGGSVEPSLADCFYFSAEAYTSLGLGDLSPAGPVRLIGGIETLNGLLLIGWSASYTFIAMERFWTVERGGHRK